MGRNGKVSGFVSTLLRHAPELVGLDMDEHGWVSTDQLIKGINETRKYGKIDLEVLQTIRKKDKKGRYRFNEDGSKIKACQGHSIPWVTPELEYKEPPEFLYHGTTTKALEMIYESGAISKMERHAVHMQEYVERAWESALRWKTAKPVVVKIAAKEMHLAGYALGEADNEVWITETVSEKYGIWCTETVPVKYIVETLYTR